MVTIRNLHFSYRRKPVFTGLDLELKPGHIHGLLGRNGTGKSTLLRNIAGYLFPDKGEIRVTGMKPGKRQPAFLQEVVLVPEDFYLPPLTVKQWVKYHAVFYRKFDRQKFRHLAREFEVPMDGSLDEMSYGQQKKALISFALATNARVLLMDEPTNGLDIVSKSQFRKVIAGSIDESKCFVISTHQVKDLENLIDRVTVIDEGRIIFNQGMDTIADNLLFRLSYDPEETARAIYHEPGFRGNALILPNTEGEDSRPDLEMLYKAIMLLGDVLDRYFKKDRLR